MTIHRQNAKKGAMPWPSSGYSSPAKSTGHESSFVKPSKDPRRGSTRSSSRITSTRGPTARGRAPSCGVSSAPSPPPRRCGWLGPSPAGCAYPRAVVGERPRQDGHLGPPLRTVRRRRRCPSMAGPGGWRAARPAGQLPDAGAIPHRKARQARQAGTGSHAPTVTKIQPDVASVAKAWMSAAYEDLRRGGPDRAERVRRIVEGYLVPWFAPAYHHHRRRQLLHGARVAAPPRSARQRQPPSHRPAGLHLRARRTPRPPSCRSPRRPERRG